MPCFLLLVPMFNPLILHQLAEVVALHVTFSRRTEQDRFAVPQEKNGI